MESCIDHVVGGLRNTGLHRANMTTLMGLEPHRVRHHDHEIAHNMHAHS